MAGSGREKERERDGGEKKEGMKPKKGRKRREGMYGVCIVLQVVVLSQMGLIARWARALAGGDWPGLEIQRGARARDLCAGPISREWPHSCVASLNLDAARG